MFSCVSVLFESEKFLLRSALCLQDSQHNFAGRQRELHGLRRAPSPEHADGRFYRLHDTFQIPF